MIWSSGSQNMVLWPASATPRNLQKNADHQAHPRPGESETLAWGSGNLGFTSPQWSYHERSLIWPPTPLRKKWSQLTSCNSYTKFVINVTTDSSQNT